MSHQRDPSRGSSSLPPMFRKSSGSGAASGHADWLSVGGVSAMRSVKTKRPFTPREKERKLFGGRWSSSFHGAGAGSLSASVNAGTSHKYWTSFAKIDENFDSHLPEVRPNTSAKGRRRSEDEANTKLPDIIPSERELRKQFRTTEPPLQVATELVVTAQHHQQTVVPQQQAQQQQQPLRLTGLALAAPLEAPAPIPPRPTADSVSLLLEKLEAHADIISQEEYLKKLKSEVLHTKLSSAMKKQILGVVAKVIEKNASNASTILSLDLLLLLKVTKANFVLSSKLFFHLASSDANDEAILANDILDHYLYLLGRSCPHKDQEAMLYGYGALKFLSFNPKLLKTMLEHGLVDLIVLHVKYLCSGCDSDDDVSAASKSVFQMTSCLRNCLNAAAGKKAFAGLNGHQLLVGLTEKFSANDEIMCNVARIVSVLSMDGELDFLADTDVISAVLGVIERHPERCDIVVRTAFYLGNLAARDDGVRLYIAEHEAMAEKVPKGVLLKLVEGLVAAKKTAAVDDDDSGVAIEADTVVKLLRVFANVSINADAGAVTAVNEGLVQALILILGAHDREVFRDILLPALSTLNNLSYYPIVQHKELFESIGPVVFHDDEAISAEALRVLGNLSRRREIREDLRNDAAFFRELFARMRWEDAEVKFSSAGIVVNLMTDREARPLFKEQHGLKLCLSLLDDTLQSKDWALASLVCQILWNYSIHAEGAGDALSRSECEDLERSLINLLDQEQLEDESCLTNQLYEEFSAVGFHLLSKLCNTAELHG